MKQAVILAAGRTGLAKSFRGSFNQTHGATMTAHVIDSLVTRSGLGKDEIEDVVIGCGYPEAETGGNIARQAGFRRVPEPALSQNMPELYHSMIETADLVAERYSISRDSQDAFSLISQQRIAKAQDQNLFQNEILPMDTVMAVKDKETGEVSTKSVTVDRDECNRPTTTLEGLQGLQVVREGGYVTAGNASQLSDGAAAAVLMDAGEAEKRGLDPLGAFKGFAVAGCGPEEMGIGPVFAVPRLLKRHGLSVDDIDIWELNEAFASQAIYCRDTLGIDPEKVNVNGGSIAISHPFGMSWTSACHRKTRIFAKMSAPF